MLKIADLKTHNASRREALWAFRSAVFTMFICGIESYKYIEVPTSNMIILGVTALKVWEPLL